MARDVLELEGVQLGYKNFEGREKKFNPAGKRNVMLFLSEEQAQAAEAFGFNVKRFDNSDINPEDQFPKSPQLKVNIKYGAISPNITIVNSENGPVALDEETVLTLDTADIEFADIVLSPYDWNVNGETGRTPYLKALYVGLDRNRFDDKYHL